MNEELLKRLGGVKSPEEVTAIAKEYGQELTQEQAQELSDKLNAGAVSGELSDEELDTVAGGGIYESFWEAYKQAQICNDCHDPEKKTNSYFYKLYGWQGHTGWFCDDCARKRGLL